AAVIYNNAPGELNGTLGSDFTGNLPVVSVTQQLGQQLASTAGLELRVKTSTFRGMATTSNVLAESKFGNPDNVVMAGAHLDSVSAGPGINDNGSGSATILEVAEQMAKVEPTNKVRFALWGAEESGLVGSHHYVDDLLANDQDELERIALYLNFDMIGSPNYARFVYDGDNSAFPVGTGSAAGPAGSGQIEDMFHDYFQSVGLVSAETPFSGRSDYGPFIAAGVDIPSGGLFTGAEGIKTDSQAEAFGGIAGAAYDPCYHQACDSLDQNFGTDTAKASLYGDLASVYKLEGNVNLEAIEEMSDAVAHAVLTYAFDTSSVTGDGFGKPVTPPGKSADGAPGGEMDDSGGGLHADHDHEADTM
ncbi:MAG: M28 family peptidase, partial [Nocardioidaceae bacterium]